MTNTNRFANARVGSGGSVRGGDMLAHDLFKIEGPDGSTFYGDYTYIFLENGYDFNIEIDAFGYIDPQRVGSTDPAAREQFSAEECSAAEQLIRSYFLSEPDIYRKRFLPPARFAGSVSFQPNWIVQRPSD
jgi:hypothetical protein